MTPRERVVAALEHRQPDRVPFAWGFGPQPPARVALDDYLRPHGLNFDELRRRTDDIRGVGAPYTGPALAARQSIWGYTTRPASYGAGSYDEFDFQPLAKATSLDDVARHAWPDANAHDFAALPDAIRALNPERRYAVECSGGNILETFSWMTGLEKTLEWLATEPEICHAALRRITDFFVTRTRRSLQAAPGLVDTVFCADDLGGQNGLLISPRMYREMIMPYHRELFAAIHEAGARVCYHSDGSVFGVLDDLIAAGIDCLEAVQIECRDMEPERLKATFGSRLAFRGAVSVQQVLPVKSADEVRAEVRRLTAVLGAGGGYICAPSHAIQAFTPPENAVAMCEEACGTTLAAIARSPA